MDKEELQKLEGLTLDLNEHLNILNSAVMNENDDLQVCDLAKFINETFNISNEVRKIFYTSLS